MLKVKNLVYISKIVFPWSIILLIVFLALGLYIGLYYSPPDYRQGEIVRIMYIHVPSAWFALGCYVLLAILGFITLTWSNLIAEMLARAVAPIGLAFTLICLITGSIWGKGTWGTWWVWDARLTSVLVLFFFYIGYLALWNTFDNELRAAKTSAIFAIFSVINVPIVKFSVDIWSTLHQPASIIRRKGVAIDIEMLQPLFCIFLAFLCLFSILLILRVSTLLDLRKIKISTALSYG